MGSEKPYLMFDRPESRFERAMLGFEISESKRPDLGPRGLDYSLRGLICDPRGPIWGLRGLIWGVRGLFGVRTLVVIRPVRGGRRPETGENRPVWNHRSSAPLGTLPKMANNV